MAEFLYGDKRPVILTVDDDEMNLLLMKRIFAKDADIFCLNSGSKALEWLAEHDPDIVLLDYHMPAPNGFDILKKMKEDKRLAKIPVIIVTGDIEADLECEGFMLGATDFIRKPFMPAVVRERVRRVLQYEYLQDNLENEVKRQTNLANQRLESIVRLYNETAFALAKAVDAKDAYTSGHSSRVAKYSRMIAERSGAGKEEQEEIYTIALLHDIGKIGIPIAIINKPARLTDQEYEIRKTVTGFGFPYQTEEDSSDKKDMENPLVYISFVILYEDHKIPNRSNKTEQINKCLISVHEFKDNIMKLSLVQTLIESVQNSTVRETVHMGITFK